MESRQRLMRPGQLSQVQLTSMALLLRPWCWSWTRRLRMLSLRLTAMTATSRDQPAMAVLTLARLLAFAQKAAMKAMQQLLQPLCLPLALKSRRVHSQYACTKQSGYRQNNQPSALRTRFDHARTFCKCNALQQPPLPLCDCHAAVCAAKLAKAQFGLVVVCCLQQHAATAGHCFETATAQG